MTSPLTIPSAGLDTHLPDLQRLNVTEVLSSVTRAERRMLLIVAMIGIVVAHTGLIPSKISALGIEFGQTDQRGFLIILIVIIGYLVGAFTLYAGADFIAWRFAYDTALLHHLKHEPAVIPEPDSPTDKPWQKAQKEVQRRRGRWSRLARTISKLRGLWEFVLPVLVGVYAIAALLWTYRVVW